MITYQEMVDLFECANAAFLKHDKVLFVNQVSERTLCGALMLHFHDIITCNKKLAGYYADVEYNRNKGSIKTIRKTIKGPGLEIIPINCDLIVHSRGKIIKQDNLIAIEMKKATATNACKEKDRERLIALTKDSFDDIWSFDGKTLPEHVCRYVLGVYYEINYKLKSILIEYYRKGRMVKSRIVDLCAVCKSAKLASASAAVREIYEDIENYIMSLGDDIMQTSLKFYTAFRKSSNFVCAEVFTDHVILHLKLDSKKFPFEKGFSRDVTKIGHYGTGNVELRIKTISDFEKAKPFIRRAYDAN
jgi:predicted transport protein